MIAVRIVWLVLLLTVIPAWIGNCFISVDKNRKNVIFMWISGQMLLWAGFQIICVPMILLGQSFPMTSTAFTVYGLAWLILATVWYLCKNRGKRPAMVSARPDRRTIVLWTVFFALLLLQLILAVVMVYNDGDDAYYVALSAATEESGEMYRKLPYTGLTTKLDIRHGLAPFPIWIAWLTRMTGLPAVVIAKTLLPLALISMTYGVFYLIGSRILWTGGEGNRWALPIFLIITEVLVMFGDYSFNTVENFMIARSRQGKAALGSILIPMIFFLLLTLMHRLQECQRISPAFWLLLGAVMVSCCLASTMGALLACMLVGTAGICGAVGYKNWKMLLPLCACCIPCVIYAGIYLVLG